MDTELRWNGPIIDSAVTQGAVAGLNLAAYEVQQRSLRKVPRDTNKLANSLLIRQATPDGLEAAVYSDLEYAVYQHEIFSYRRRVGQPKYLESAALEFENGFRKLVAKTIKDHAN